MTKEIRRNMPLFPMSIVMQLTELSARQIRYYEQQGLITPKRNKGKQRIFSLNDIDRLLEIKDLLDQGVNIAGIKAIVALKEKDGQQTVAAEVGHKHNQDQEEISDRDLHRLLKTELLSSRAQRKVTLIQGELSRFFH